MLAVEAQPTARRTPRRTCEPTSGTCQLEGCGRAFVTTSRTRKYCSDRCRVKAFVLRKDGRSRPSGRLGWLRKTEGRCERASAVFRGVDDAVCGACRGRHPGRPRPLHRASTPQDALVGSLELGARHVLADLTDVTFIDSTALGVLIRAAKELRAAGGELDLVCPNQDIRRLVQLTGLDSVFILYTSLQEAMDAASPR